MRTFFSKRTSALHISALVFSCLLIFCNVSGTANALDLGVCPEGQNITAGGGCATPAQIKKDAETQGAAMASGADKAQKGADIVANAAADAASALISALGKVILSLTNLILGTAGVLLNWVIVRTVFQFSNLIGNSSGLLTAWGILRDIGNLLLLFGFLILGIGTILDSSKLPTKKALPGLIMFAVLLNFSLFAAEAVIDISNILSSAIYSQANTNPCLEIGNQDCAINLGIAGHIMQASGLSSIYSMSSGGDPINDFVIIVGLTIFGLMGAVVLFAAAIMLAYRAILLTGLIIVSPIGFAGMAIPFLESMAKSWWKQLMHQAFFAPILLLLIFVSLKVTEGFAKAGNNGNLAAALTHHDASAMGSIMVFVLVIMALVASLMAAQKFGAAGAGFAIEKATGLAFGGYTRLANFTGGGAGRIGRFAVQNTALKNTAVGRAAVNRVFRPLETANLDPRRLPGVSSQLSKRLGVKGAAQPEKNLTFRSQVGQINKTIGPERIKEGKKESQNLTAQYNKEMAIKVLKNHKGESLDTENLKTLASQSAQQLADLDVIKNAMVGDNAKYVRGLSKEKYEELLKEDSLSDQQKSDIRAARTTLYDNTMVDDPTAPAGSPQITRAKRTIQKMKVKQVNDLDDLTLQNANVLAGMTPIQLFNLDPRNLDASTLAAVRDHIAAGRASGDVQITDPSTGFDTLMGTSSAIRNRWNTFGVT